MPLETDTISTIWGGGGLILVWLTMCLVVICIKADAARAANRSLSEEEEEPEFMPDRTGWVDEERPKMTVHIP